MTIGNLKQAMFLNNTILLDKIQALKNQIDGLVGTDIEELNDAIDTINHLIVDLNNELDQLNDSTLAAIDERITVLENSVGILTNNLQVLDTQVNDRITSEVQSLNESIDNIRLDFTALEEVVNNHISDLVIHVTQQDKDLWNSILANANAYALGLFNTVNSFKIQVVSVLPTTPEEFCIYLLPATNGNNGDVYDEYIFINSSWEKIGSTAIDLSGYALKSELHTHDNKTILDKFSVDENGTLLYDNNLIEGGGSNITISQQANNAIEQLQDGIFVEDFSDEINEINIKLGNIGLITDIENEELDHCIVSVGNNTSNFYTNETVLPVIPLSYVVSNNNMEYNSVDYSITLKANKTYYIQGQIAAWGANINSGIGIYDATNDKVLGIIGLKFNYTNGQFNDTVANCVVKPTSDIKVQLKIAYTAITANFTLGGLSYITVCEVSGSKTINNNINLDIDTISKDFTNIEDTPVGHILAHMGTTPPPHYLICDGAEYNIIDYKHLAEHIKKDFGSYDYFGGDGVLTFCVPNSIGMFLKGNDTLIGAYQEAGLPNITANWKSEPSASANGAVWITSESGTLQAVTSGGSSDSRVHFDASRSNDIYGKSETVTPKNISVLYCIKYEPTYFMNVTQEVVINTEEKTLEYGLAKLASNLTSQPNRNNWIIPFNQLNQEFTNIEWDSLKYGFKLSSGKTYRVRGSYRIYNVSGDSSFFMYYYIYDVVNKKVITNNVSAGVCEVTPTADFNTKAELIIKPTQDITVGLYCDTGSNETSTIFTIQAIATFLEVQEIGYNSHTTVNEIVNGSSEVITQEELNLAISSAVTDIRG